MIETLWDKKISGHETRSPLSYRAPGPLEGCPGSDAYFSAVMNSMRREVEARRGPFAEPKPKKTPASKVRVVKTTVDALSPQHCDGCGKMMDGYTECFAVKLCPVVFCAPCYLGSSTASREWFDKNWGGIVPAVIFG